MRQWAEIFTGGDPEEVYENVNEFLGKLGDGKLTQMLQSESYCENGWSLTITVLYRSEQQVKTETNE